MANVKGRGVTVEIAATYGTAKTVTAVTKASPGVATSTSHGLANDTVGYWSGVTGMAQLEGQATRVKNQSTNAFDLQGLNTTNYATFTAGTFTPVSTWATLSEATSYDIGGGAAEKLDVTRLLDITKQEEQGLLPVGTVSMNVLAQETRARRCCCWKTPCRHRARWWSASRWRAAPSASSAASRRCRANLCSRAKSAPARSTSPSRALSSSWPPDG